MTAPACGGVLPHLTRRREDPPRHLTACLTGQAADRTENGQMALDIPCPNCGTQMYAEQAHNRCPNCRYYEPCCDGAPQACPITEPATG